MMKYDDELKCMPMCDKPMTISDKVDSVNRALDDLHVIADSLENKLIGAMPKEDECNRPPKPYGGINEYLDNIGNKLGHLFSVLSNLNERL